LILKHLHTNALSRPSHNQLVNMMCSLQDAAAAALTTSEDLALGIITSSPTDNPPTSSSTLDGTNTVGTTTSPAGTSPLILPGRKHAGRNRKNGHLTTRAERAQRKAEKEKLRQAKAEEAAAQAQAEAKLAKQLAVRVFVRCHEEVR
jgi:hypothetical protein